MLRVRGIYNKVFKNVHNNSYHWLDVGWPAGDVVGDNTAICR